jgi:hypothetical protein
MRPTPVPAQVAKMARLREARLAAEAKAGVKPRR